MSFITTTRTLAVFKDELRCTITCITILIFAWNGQINAGIVKGRNLEPEADSHYRQVVTERDVPEEQARNERNTTETRRGLNVQIIDIGGGSAVITLHQHKETDSTTELNSTTVTPPYNDSLLTTTLATVEPKQQRSG